MIGLNLGKENKAVQGSNKMIEIVKEEPGNDVKTIFIESNISYNINYSNKEDDTIKIEVSCSDIYEEEIEKHIKVDNRYGSLIIRLLFYPKSSENCATITLPNRSFDRLSLFSRDGRITCNNTILAEEFNAEAIFFGTIDLKVDAKKVKVRGKNVNVDSTCEVEYLK